MKQKTLILSLTLVSLAMACVGYYLSNAYEKGLCGMSIFCHDLMIWGHALFFGTLSLGVVFLVLWFVPKAFSAWKKFAVWAVPLMALVFIFYKGSGGFDFVSPHPEIVYKWTAGLYVLVSLAIIALASRKK